MRTILILLAVALLAATSAFAETLRVGKAGREAFSFVPVDIGVRTGIFVAALGPTDQAHRPTATGSLQVVDERTDAVVRTIAVGMAPYAVALDGPARRALVFNAGGGTVRVPDPWGWVPPWLRRVLPFLPRGTPQTHTMPASVTIIDTSHL